MSVPTGGVPSFGGFDVPMGEQIKDLGYAAGWGLIRTMPEFAARNMFDAGALYAARGGGPEQRHAAPRMPRRHRGDVGLAVYRDDGTDGIGEDEARMVADLRRDRLHGHEARRSNPRTQDSQK